MSKTGSPFPRSVAMRAEDAAQLLRRYRLRVAREQHGFGWEGEQFSFDAGVQECRVAGGKYGEAGASLVDGVSDERDAGAFAPERARVVGVAGNVQGDGGLSPASGASFPARLTMGISSVTKPPFHVPEVRLDEHKRKVNFRQVYFPKVDFPIIMAPGIATSVWRRACLSDVSRS